MGRGHAAGVVLVGLAVSLGGCCKSRQQEEPEPGKTVEGDACEMLLDDDFEQALGTHWTTGTNTKQNSNGPSVTAEQGQLVFSQHYDYVETKESFSGDFELELLGISRKAGSNQCADLFVELVAAPEQAGIFRFRYGVDKKESVNIGKAPKTNQTRAWSCIRDTPYLKEFDAQGESKGRLRLEHKEHKIRFSYTDNTNRTLTTSWVGVPAFASTKVRIWGLGGRGATRTIDRVTLCAKRPKAKPAGESPAPGKSEKAGNEPTLAAADPMPLKKGNRWVYRFQSPTLNGTFSYVAGAKEQVGGVEVVRTQYTDTSGLYGNGYWQLLANDGSRLHFYGDSVRGKTTQPDLWMDSAFKDGDTWKTNFSAQVAWKVLSRSESVTVPAGTFKDCVHIRGTNAGAGNTTDHWWAIGVGAVKMQQPMGPTMMSFELVSYEFK